MDFEVLPDAELQIRAIDGWWRENRTAAPTLFADEVVAAILLIQSSPRIGRRLRHRAVAGLRRVLLRATRYHLYYAPSPDGSRLYIVAVWSGLRGKGPPLKAPG